MEVGVVRVELEAEYNGANGTVDVSVNGCHAVSIRALGDPWRCDEGDIVQRTLTEWLHGLEAARRWTVAEDDRRWNASAERRD